jgi:hypothetical protein
MKTILLFTLAQMWPWGWLTFLCVLGTAVCVILLAKNENKKAEQHMNSAVDKINKQHGICEVVEDIREIISTEKAAAWYFTHLHNSLSYRARYALSQIAVTNLEEFMDLTSADLEGIYRCGPVTRREILDMVACVSTEDKL